MNISLPTGPFDWSATLIPLDEVDRRMRLAREAMRAAGVARLIVHGDGFDHGALTWLTGFTPKLGPAFAVLSAEEPPALLFSGGPGMIASARKLTWLSELKPIRDVAGDLSALLAAGAGAVGLCEGASMADAAHAAVTRAIGASPNDLTPTIEAARRVKAPLEVAFIDQAAAAVEAARRALENTLPQGRREALVAAERAAIDAGAQDVRVMSATRAGGRPRPLDANDGVIAGTVPVAIAARVRGYWASLETVISAPDDEARAARAALAKLAAGLAPGRAPLLPADLPAHWTLRVHGVGLSLEEPAADGAPVAGEVICLRLQSATAGQYGAWSALAHLGAGGARVLSMA